MADANGMMSDRKDGWARAIRGAWRGVREAAEALAFPTECQVCGLDPIGDGAVCDDCRVELVEAAGVACMRCAMPVGPHADAEGGCGACRGRRLGFDAAVALGPYQGPIRHLCLRIKRRDQAWLAPSLADLLVEARGDAMRAIGAGAVAPVPLHWARKRRRGYDQAEALAIRLAARLDLPMARPLRRVRATEPLGPLGRVDRQRLMRGVFRADRHRAARLAGRAVLLVDDILTTGATCGAASRALKAAGVGAVVAVVIGRAEGRS